MRKDYDDAREDVLEDIKDPQKRSSALTELDNVNSIMIMLEEQKMPWLQKRRMKKQVKFAIKKVRLMLKEDDALD